MMHPLNLLPALVLLSTAVMAEPAAVRMELNKLEPSEAACRTYLVMENGTGIAFESLKLDLVMFDTDGVVNKRLAVETGPLPADKTRLQVFDMDGVSCSGLGRVLLNDVMTCSDAKGARADCLGLVQPVARGELSFIK